MHWSEDSKHLVSASQDGKLIVRPIVRLCAALLVTFILSRFGAVLQRTKYTPFLCDLVG